MIQMIRILVIIHISIEVKIHCLTIGTFDFLHLITKVSRNMSKCLFFLYDILGTNFLLVMFGVSSLCKVLNIFWILTGIIISFYKYYYYLGWYFSFKKKCNTVIHITYCYRKCIHFSCIFLGFLITLQ